jgi:tetratricopeptide (TPR) repeat protein
MDAKLQRAITLHQQGQLTQARTLYESILKKNPRHFDCLHLLGVIAAQLKNPARAVQLIERAIDVHPHDAAAHCNLGSAFKELDQFESAIACYDRAIAIRPDYADAYFNRSIAARELKDWAMALASCDAAIALRSNFAQAHCSRGKVFKEQRQWNLALACFDRAIELKPGFAEAHTERGIVLRELGEHEAALESYAAAIEFDPKHFQAYVSRGNLQKERGDADAALESFARAIAIKPDCATAHCNRSTILLVRGDFENGWHEFEWRWRERHGTLIQQKRHFSQPQWLGAKSLARKTILLHHEQGLGDTLQFCRYATLVAELGARVLLQVPNPLTRLLRSLAGVAAVFAEGEPLPAFDYYCPLMSLPLAFKTQVSTIPARIPYLASPPETARYWRDKFGASAKLRVGLVWSGGFRPTQPEVWAAHQRRNIPLAMLAPLAHPDVEFYSLQKGEPAESELSALHATAWQGPSIIDATAELADFADTAGLVEQLDLVIAVDTSTAHLAGALGKPVWILNRHDTCWRWLLDRNDTPWYPSARLYRQSSPGDWAGVVTRLRTDLARLAAGVAVTRRRAIDRAVETDPIEPAR